MTPFYTPKVFGPIITTIAVVLVVLLALALAGTRLVGLQPYVVLSGSMEPTFPTGSVVYVQPVDAADVAVGDVITYRVDGDAVVTHRVTDVMTDQGSVSFRTKGDANSVEDGGAISESQVIGKALVAIPHLGYLVEFLHSSYGRIAAVAVGVALVLIVVLSGQAVGRKTAPSTGKVG